MLRRRKRSRWPSVVAIVLFVAGLLVTAGTPFLLWWNRHHAERLRATGVPVEAAITAWSTKERSHAAADYIDLTYTFDGVTYSSQTRCGGRHGCARPPGPTLELWVDPHDPGDYVTGDGNTNDADLATSYLVLPGAFLLLIGGLGIWATKAAVGLSPRRGGRPPIADRAG